MIPQPPSTRLARRTLYVSLSPTLAHALTSPQDGQSSPFLSFINSATAYANISDLLGSSYTTFQANIASALETSASSLVPSQDPTVIAGYKAIYNTTASLMNTPVGQVEILLSLTGTTQNSNKIIAIQAALQHPFRWVLAVSARERRDANRRA